FLHRPAAREREHVDSGSVVARRVCDPAAVRRDHRSGYESDRQSHVTWLVRWAGGSIHRQYGQLPDSATSFVGGDAKSVAVEEILAIRRPAHQHGLVLVLNQQFLLRAAIGGPPVDAADGKRRPLGVDQKAAVRRPERRPIGTAVSGEPGGRASAHLLYP